MDEFLYKAAIIAFIVCVLAYYIPGLVLRAIRDFKKNYKKTTKEE